MYSGNHWCPYCSGRKGNFQEELATICKNHNGELISDYIDAQTHVLVKCNEHNYVWDMLPSNLKKGRWCPICSMGFNEKVVWDYLKNMMCNIQVQYRFDDLVGENNEKLKFDFAVFNDDSKLVYLIEIDDEEHRCRCLSDTPRQNQRKMALERDKIKDEYCKNNNIPLFRMEVPFKGISKWDYEDYYRYINTELKFIVNLSRK